MRKTKLCHSLTYGYNTHLCRAKVCNRKIDRNRKSASNSQAKLIRLNELMRYFIMIVFVQIIVLTLTHLMMLSCTSCVMVVKSQQITTHNIKISSLSTILFLLTCYHHHHHLVMRLLLLIVVMCNTHSMISMRPTITLRV